MHATLFIPASPAPRLASLPGNTLNGPSPSKRRKLATPGPTLNRSSSSSTPTRAQIDAGLRASSMRVLSVWSTLEDKYTRRLDEDDIVDLRSGGLVRDRGVLSSKAGTWDIGCFAGAEPSEEDYCEEDSNAPEEEEDDEDEIGGWGSQAGLDQQVKHVPVQELDPEDAEDLRAFLAAEDARKAEEGDDISEIEEPPEEEHALYLQDARDDTDGSVVEVEAESALALSDEESVDELDGYDETVGEGALLWEVATDLPDNCSEPLGDESSHPVQCSVSMPIPMSPMARRRQTPVQLRTPPLSRCSAVPPNQVLLHEPYSEKTSKPSASSPLTPTKNLVPEILISSRFRARAIVTEDAGKAMPSKPYARVSHSLNEPSVVTRTCSPVRRCSPAPAQVADIDEWASEPAELDNISQEMSTQSHSVPLRRTVKRKRRMSEEMVVENRGIAASEDTPQRLRSRSQHHPLPAAAQSAALDFWPPYPSIPMPHRPHHLHAHGPSVPPDLHSLHPQLIIAQAMQSLSYLAFAGAPPPPTASFAGPPLPTSHSRHASHSNSHSPSHSPYMPPPSTPSWSYPTPYYSSSPHPPWIYPQYPHPYPSSPPAHPHASSPPSSTPFTPGPSGPPSSPFEPPRSSPTPSPLSGKGKGKGKGNKVSFSDEDDRLPHSQASESKTSVRQSRGPNSQRRPSAARRHQEHLASGSGSRSGSMSARKTTKE